VRHSSPGITPFDPTKISTPLTLLRSAEEGRGNLQVRHTSGVVTPAVAKVVMTPKGVKAGTPGYYRLALDITTGFFVFGSAVSKGDGRSLSNKASVLTAYDAAGRAIDKIVMPYS